MAHITIHVQDILSMIACPITIRATRGPVRRALAALDPSSTALKVGLLIVNELRKRIKLLALHCGGGRFP